MLRIAPNLRLTDDFVTKTAAILAQRRKGKTYTGAVLAEELVRIKMPFVALDPTGAWWGLRASADGTTEGLPVTILGGQHGDVPIAASDGVAVADLVVNEPGHYVIDFSLLPSRVEEREFSTAFAQRLHRRKMQPGMDFPLHLFIDEADLFVPQEREVRADTAMLGAYQGIVRRGGLHGLGTTLISQRPALINKSVLTQLDILIILRLVAGNDQDAIDKNYVSRAGTKEQRAELMSSLASLGLGEAWVWEPGAEPAIYQRVHIRERTTFNSSATPKPGERRAEPRKLAPVDLQKVMESLAVAVERAKELDPEVLHKRIRTLEGELTRARSETVVPEAPEPELVETPVAVVPEDSMKHLSELSDRMGELATGLSETMGEMTIEVDRRMKELLADWTPTGTSTRTKTGAKAQSRRSAPAPERTPERTSTPLSTGRKAAKNSKKPAPDRLLMVYAQYPDGITVHRAAIMAGVSPKKSTVRNAMSFLRGEGLVYPSEPVRITPKGLAQVGPVGVPPTGPELIDYWLEEVGDGAPGQVLQVLIDAYPDALDSDEVATKAGWEPGISTIRNALSLLRGLGLAENVARGIVKATDDLMQAGRR